MNNEEAKFLLQAYRPNGRDAQDPQFLEALEQVKRDPGLEQWFREQQAYDRAISEKVRAVPVPASLKADILAGRKTFQPTSWWTRRSMVTALAACLVALLSLIAVLMLSSDRLEFARFRADMVEYIQNAEQDPESLRLTPSDVTGIQSWIAENADQLQVEVPPALSEGSGVGCSVVDWNGESVVLACFRLEGGKVAHLLVIDRHGLRHGPEPGVQYVASLEGMNTAAWSTDDETYLLVSSAPQETLRGLL